MHSILFPKISLTCACTHLFKKKNVHNILAGWYDTWYHWSIKMVLTLYRYDADDYQHKTGEYVLNVKTQEIWKIAFCTHFSKKNVYKSIHSIFPSFLNLLQIVIQFKINLHEDHSDYFWHCWTALLIINDKPLFKVLCWNMQHLQVKCLWNSHSYS